MCAGALPGGDAGCGNPVGRAVLRREAPSARNRLRRRAAPRDGASRAAAARADRQWYHPAGGARAKVRCLLAARALPTGAAAGSRFCDTLPTEGTRYGRRYAPHGPQRRRMKRHLNTLFVTTQGAYLSKDGEAVLVRVENETRLRVPIHTLGGIVCFGRVGCSPFLMGLCAKRGVSISLLTENGRFLARVHGFTPGNVLLRREQYRRADDAGASAEIARSIVLGKLANARIVLQRAGRDHPENGDSGALRGAIAQLDRCIGDAQSAVSLKTLRGAEGEAARAYFGVFNRLITAQREDFVFRERS